MTAVETRVRSPGVSKGDVADATSLAIAQDCGLLGGGADHPIPDYLRRVYHWAYLDPRNVARLDRAAVVDTILFGNQRRLRRWAFREFLPGQRVLQTGAVYGDFLRALARHLGPRGHLEVIDVAPIQVENCRRKLAGLDNVRIRIADAAQPGGGPYDAVSCFFLLHELPDCYKRLVVPELLNSVVAGGRVVFVDYHQPHGLHPMRPLMSLVFDRLEPYAKELWHRPIDDYGAGVPRIRWSKEMLFGGLYQKVVAIRSDAAGRRS